MAEHIIGSVDDFPPGTHRVVRAGRAEIGVFNVDGNFYALPNVCTHQFGPLCEGPVGGTMACGPDTGWRHEWVREGQVLTCPWHGLEFDITTGRCLASSGIRVRQYNVTVEDGQVKLVL